jgi:hypothetical protein
VGAAEKLALNPVTVAKAAETDRLVKDLASADFAVRERASKELETSGIEAFPRLREAVEAANDPELTARTSAILEARSIQAGPAVPSRVLAMIKRYCDDRARILEVRNRMVARMRANARGAPVGIVEQSPLTFLGSLDDESAGLFLKIILLQETDARFHELAEQADAKRGQIKARLAIAAGRFDEAEKLLLGSAGNRDGGMEDWVILRALREGPTLDPEKELAKLKAVGKAGDLAAAWLYRAKGDFARSAEYGKHADGDTWAPTKPMLIETGQWAALAEFVDGVPGHNVPDSAWLLTYWMQGREQQFREMVDAKFASTGNSGFVPAYLLSDRAEDAIAGSIRSQDQRWAGFHLLCAQLRVREALASVKNSKLAPPELARPLVARGLNRAARELLGKMTPSDTIEHEFPPRGYFFYAGAWELAGDSKAAADWRRRGLEVLGPKESAFRQGYEQLQSLEARIKALPKGRSDRDLDLQRARLKAIVDVPGHVNDIMVVGPYPAIDLEKWNQAIFWRDAILAQEKGELPERYEKAVRIIRGDIAPADVDKLIDDAIQNLDPRTSSSLGPLRSGVEQFHQLHHDDWALRLVSAAVTASHDPGHWALMGDVELDNAHWEKAAEYYQRAAVLNLTDGALAYRLGFALSKVPAKKAAGEQLMALAPFLVLADIDKAQALAEAMRRCRGDEAADEWYEAYSLRYSRMDLSRFGTTWVIARDAAEKRGDFAQAFKQQKKLMFSVPYDRKGIYDVPSQQMLNWARYYRLQTLEAVGRKDIPAMVAGLEGELRNGPPDVELVERVWPLVKDEPRARQVLATALARLKAIVEDYPEAADGPAAYGRQVKRLEALR